MTDIEIFCNFDHDYYITNNIGLSLIKTKNQSWYHYNKYGKKEGRVFRYKNNEISISKEYFEDNYTIYISRYCNSETTGKYWKYNYELIRNLYKKVKIIIIDDNSNPEFIKDDNLYRDIEFIYTKGTNMVARGELLPIYYHYYNNKTPYALMIHDSVFIHKPIHEYIYKDDFISLWDFNSINYYQLLEKRTNELMTVVNKSSKLADIWKCRLLWEGVFGTMGIVSYEYLHKLHKEFNFGMLYNEINNRTDRMVLERLMAIFYFCIHNKTPNSILGNIHIFNENALGKLWDLSWEEYMNDENLKNNMIVKVWTVR